MSVTQDNRFTYIKNKLYASGIIKTSNSDEFSSNLGKRYLASHSWRFALLLLISNYALQNVLTMRCRTNRDFFMMQILQEKFNNALRTTASMNINVLRAHI